IDAVHQPARRVTAGDLLHRRDTRAAGAARPAPGVAGGHRAMAAPHVLAAPGGSGGGRHPAAPGRYRALR
ncbi:hypothetical protein, partial [Acinetobacter baumannii]|uniref:hypothetical protein n=1 Tax=Acinetobacter baumannii TaxID=470 RepID=UPI002091D0FA